MNRILPKQSLDNLQKGRGWNKGKKQSEATKRKISEATKGRTPWNKKPPTRCKFCKIILGRHHNTMCFDCYKKYELGQKITGIKKTKKHRDKLSEARKNSPLVPRGKNHHSWKGGVTPENEKIRKSRDYKLWRTACFKRDNYTCQNCGGKGGELEVHHIKPFSDNPDFRLTVDNGITYCIGCHKLKDKFRK